MRFLVAMLLLVVLGACGTDEQDRESPPSPAPTPTTPAGWRTESWHGVELSVPASWAIGVAPVAQRDGRVLSCGVGPDPFSRAGTSPPYVGRPVIASDACVRAEVDEVQPPKDAVWFGSPLPEGERDGVRTIAVGDRGHVTIGATDPDIGARILASVRTVEIDANGCPSRKVVEHGWPTEGVGEVHRFAVCVYDGPDLLWSQRRSATEGDRFVRAFDHSRPHYRWPPSRYAPVRYSVVLRVTADDPMGEDDVVVSYEVRFDPARIVTPDGRATGLTPPTVRPWAGEGIRLYCAGPVPKAVAAYFRPTLG